MVRLRDKRSGVIVDVSEEAAGRLSGFEPVKAPATPRKSKTTPKKDAPEK